MKVTGTDGKEYTIEPDAKLRGADLSGAETGNFTTPKPSDFSTVEE
jgi:hypothetical protein